MIMISGMTRFMCRLGRVSDNQLITLYNKMRNQRHLKSDQLIDVTQRRHFQIKRLQMLLKQAL